MNFAQNFMKFQIEARHWKIFIIVLVALTGLLDIGTTIGLQNLETNPLILLGGIWLIALIKMLVLAVISFQFYKIDSFPRMIQFLLCTGMVLAIILQAFAVLNNSIVIERYHGQSVPEPTVHEKINYAKNYMLSGLIFFYYPLFVSMISFTIFDLVRMRKWKK